MPTPIIVEPDELKKHFPGYNPSKSEEHHEASAKLADKWFAAAVKYVPVGVVLLAGGAASGKTEYLEQFIRRFGTIGGVFYDGTLPHVPEIKMKIVEENNRRMEVHFVLPKDLKKSFAVFLNRERKFADKHFYRTHNQSRKTVLELAQNYPRIKIRVIESSFGKLSEATSFTEKYFDSRSEQIDFLTKIQYSEHEIIKLISE